MPITGSSSREWVKPRDLAEREGVARQTIWRWVDKGLVETRRLAPQTGVQVRLAKREGGDR